MQVALHISHKNVRIYKIKRENNAWAIFSISVSYILARARIKWRERERESFSDIGDFYSADIPDIFCPPPPFPQSVARECAI